MSRMIHPEIVGDASGSLSPMKKQKFCPLWLVDGLLMLVDCLHGVQ